MISLIQLIVLLISISIFIYTLFLSIKILKFKSILALFLELISLVTLNWSFHLILKVGSVAGIVFLLLSGTLLYFTIRYLIINSKFKKL